MSAHAAVEAAVAEFGALHTLVNNAAIDRRGVSEADWHRVMAVNLKGPFLCAQAGVRHLNPRGAIVNFSSPRWSQLQPAPGCHYSASRVGLLGLTRHLARERGPSRIRVDAVCPDLILTDMLTRSTPTERVAELAAQVPIGRVSTPADIAGAIASLASDDARCINGASMDANGRIL